MIELKSFTFNPFQENMYVLWDETKECIIIDPGCSTREEENELKDFIEKMKLKPVQLLNTHCHIDHILGNAFCVDRYKIPFYHHKLDLPVLANGRGSAAMFGIRYTDSPAADGYLKEGTPIKWGKSQLDVVFTPGHSPGSVCFIADQEEFVIGGDVLFQLSIGRTDLPGGDHDTLLKSIRSELFTLSESYVVHPGHGPVTKIGSRRKIIRI